MVTAAFAEGGGRYPPAEVALVQALRGEPETFSWVAESDGDVVAHALLSRVFVGPGRAPALALAPVAVVPSEQRHGHGSAVVRAVLDAASAAGERIVLVLGDPAYYGRFGFRPASEFGLSGPWQVPDEAFQALPLAAYVDEPATRGMVLYPAAFDVF